MNVKSNASLATNQAEHKPRFFKMTAERAKADYKEKLITTEAYILYLLDAHRSIGWKWKVEPKEFCKTWDIPRSTFYKAISKLKTKGKLNWELEGTITLWRGSDIGMQDSLIDEPSSPTHETNSLVDETNSLVDETVVSLTRKQGTQTLTQQEVENPIDIKQTYTDFINSLSEAESENFLTFCEEKTRNLNQPVNDIEAWLAHTTKAGQKRWEVYYNKYKASQQSKPKKSQANVKTQWQMHQEELEQQRQRAMAHLEL